MVIRIRHRRWWHCFIPSLRKKRRRLEKMANSILTDDRFREIIKKGKHGRDDR